MNNHEYILSLVASEQRLKENFIKIAEYYKTEPGIYYGCQEMASISDEHLRKIRAESGVHSESQVSAHQETHLSMIAEHEPGSDLFQDLCFMWLLTMQVAMFNSLLLHTFPNNPGNDSESLYLDFERETEKQSQWLMYRINMTVEKVHS